jgi:hypothetical protein
MDRKGFIAMSDPTIAAPIDEITRLRARVRELEAQLNKAADTKSDDEDSPQTSTRRVADSMSNVSRSKRDATNRMVRGATLASAELVRAFADTVSSFADTLISRNDSGKDGSRTTRDLVTRLPEDIATSFADAIDRFVEVPAKAADRYASAYRSGEKTDSRR